ncbi:hypothetical protein A7E75_05675 [Syntrophotalea acetylenica]|jgi:hypothetical protein|uniref:Uncharacterized protein n=1 Tax=Syntrophotalea acetylenica TaxID=29542 RepID=A0A1L3GF68_SYNAC|nr:hypothetical protein A7E75_05675 [Syntrophotalea acetylenica]
MRKFYGKPEKMTPAVCTPPEPVLLGLADYATPMQRSATANQDLGGGASSVANAQWKVRMTPAGPEQHKE